MRVCAGRTLTLMNAIHSACGKLRLSLPRDIEHYAELLGSDARENGTPPRIKNPYSNLFFPGDPESFGQLLAVAWTRGWDGRA